MRTLEQMTLTTSCQPAGCAIITRANSLETFRRYIEEIPRKLRENYIYKVGIVYGEIAEQTHPVKFYFEQQEGMKNE